MRRSEGTPWCGAGAPVEGLGGSSSDGQKSKTGTWRFYSSLVVAEGGKKLISKLLFLKTFQIFTPQSLFKGQIYSSFASPKKRLVLWLNIKAAAWHSGGECLLTVTIFSSSVLGRDISLQHSFDVFFHSGSQGIFSIEKQHKFSVPAEQGEHHCSLVQAERGCLTDTVVNWWQR